MAKDKIYFEQPDGKIGTKPKDVNEMRDSDVATRADVRAIIREELENLESIDRYTIQKLLQMFDGRNIQTGRTIGTKIGTATDQKIGFYNTTPVVQPTTSVGEAAFVAGAGTAVNDNSTFGGYTIQQVVQALQDEGLLA